MRKLTSHILQFLIYFDLFSYPLTRNELAMYIGLGNTHHPALDDALEALKNQGLVKSNNGLYYISDDEAIINRRVEGNNRWTKRMAAAKRYSAIISAFPYVRGVCLSGSISKGYIGQTDDIDYFIITSPGRLWFVRTLLTLFKKIFLLNSRKYFCINYFVDTNSLVFRERNLYKATEIVSLIPTYNPQLYDDIIEVNGWLKDYYPTYRQNGKYVITYKPVVKRLIESLFSNMLGNFIDEKLFSISKQVIRNKYSYMSQKDFDHSFSLQKHEIKYFPNHTKMNIMERYQERLKTFSASHPKLLADIVVGS